MTFAVHERRLLAFSPSDETMRIGTVKMSPVLTATESIAIRLEAGRVVSHVPVNDVVALNAHGRITVAAIVSTIEARPPQLTR